MTTTNVTIFRVDFNSVHPESWRVLGLVQWATPSGSPEVGDYVLLVDDENSECWAWVAAAEGERVEFELDRGSWRSGDRAQISAVPPASLVVCS